MKLMYLQITDSRNFTTLVFPDNKPKQKEYAKFEITFEGGM